MISANQAIYSLYKQVQGTEYKPSTHWTATQTFSPAYKTIKSEFVPETLKQVAPPKGIEPLFPRS